MKKPDAFDAKRKTRDKALKRWVKSRDIVAPAIIVLTGISATVGGVIGNTISQEIGAVGILVGAVFGLCVGAPYVVRKLSE